MEKISKRRLNLLTGMFVLIAFMLGCNEYMVVGNLSLIAATYHVSLSQIAGLVSIFAWTYAIATPILALITNRIHKYWLLIALLLIFLIGTILSAYSINLTWLLISRVLTASVAGLIESLLSVIVYQLSSDEKQRSMMIAWIYTGFSIASVLGVPFGTFIAEHWKWQDAFVMVAIITLVATIVSLLILPKDLAKGKGGIKEQLVLFKDKDILLAIFFVIFATGAFYGYYTYIRSLITTTLGFSLNLLSIILLLLGIDNVIANQLSGRLAAIGGMKELKPIYVGMDILLCLFALSMGNQWTGIVMLFVLGFIVILFGSPAQVFFLDITSKKYPQAVTLSSTFNAVFWNVGVAISSLTAGEFLKVGGLTSLGWNSLIYGLLATIFLFSLCRSYYGKKEL